MKASQSQSSVSPWLLQRWQVGLFLILGWLVVIIVCGWVRPLLPPNELRYISVAWEMWVQHSFILPLNGGVPYAEKPPLLFWLVHVGWVLFGVNSWWPRLVPELFGLACLGLVYQLARQLWQSQLQLALIVPVLLLGMVGWLAELGLFKFDVMLSFFVLTTLYFLLRVLTAGGWYWLGLIFALALGILAKGPVCLLFVLPVMLSAPWWSQRVHSWFQYYGLLLTVVLIACLLVLIWAVPAAWLGGKSYAQTIFWHQSIGRVSGDYGVAAPWYTYLSMLAWMLLPWILWLTLWQGLWLVIRRWHDCYQDRGLRFVLAAIVPALILLSLIPEKGERYLVPLLPWCAVFFAYILNYWLASPTNSRYEPMGGIVDNQPPRCGRFAQCLVATFYIGLGAAYLLLPHLASSRLQQHYFWLHELSPLWGYILIMMGMMSVLFYHHQPLINMFWLALLSILLFIIYNLSIVSVLARYNDLRPIGQRMAQLQRHNLALALYPSDFGIDFFGRLQRPATLLTNQPALMQWLNEHPTGWVLSFNGKVYPHRYILKPASWYVQAHSTH